MAPPIQSRSMARSRRRSTQSICPLTERQLHAYLLARETLRRLKLKSLRAGEEPASG